MSKHFFGRFVVLAILALFFLVNVPDRLDAAPRRGPGVVSNRIPEDQRPWPGWPWVVGIVLTAGAVTVALKNSKRSHLD